MLPTVDIPGNFLAPGAETVGGKGWDIDLFKIQQIIYTFSWNKYLCIFKFHFYYIQKE